MNSGISPGHNPILKNILIKFSKVMATEVPVWKRLDDNEYIVGHIDLILVDGGTLIVADYKPNEIKMIKS